MCYWIEFFLLILSQVLMILKTLTNLSLSTESFFISLDETQIFEQIELFFQVNTRVVFFLTMCSYMLFLLLMY